MKTKVFFIALSILCFATASRAQQKFNVQNGSKTEFYDDLETAVKKAASGDTIYLPGGVVRHPNTALIIDKKLALIGAGCDMDSIGGLQRTELKQNDGSNLSINFREGSNGSLITGCVLGGIILGEEALQKIESITISRNNIVDIYLGVNGTNNQVKNIFIRENVISYMYGNNATNCWINNNLILYYFQSLKNSHVYNNIMSNYGIVYMDACTFENNFIRGGISGSTNCTFNNNAFTDNITFPNGSNNGANNLVNQETARTFQVNDLGYPKNLKIRNDSPCKGAGADGTDIGIYGGSEPYRAIPFNPHIEKAVVSSQTDKAGILKVDFEVSARDK